MLKDLCLSAVEYNKRDKEFNFILSNGARTESDSFEKMTHYRFEERICRVLIFYHYSGQLDGFKFLNDEGKVILEVGECERDLFNDVKIDGNERIIGVRSEQHTSLVARFQNNFQFIICQLN